jgi:hypothetical protein
LKIELQTRRSKEHRAKSDLNNTIFDNIKVFEDVISLRGFDESPGMKLHHVMLARVAAMATAVEIATNMLDQDSLRVD